MELVTFVFEVSTGEFFCFNPNQENKWRAGGKESGTASYMFLYIPAGGEWVLGTSNPERVEVPVRWIVNGEEEFR